MAKSLRQRKRKTYDAIYRQLRSGHTLADSRRKLRKNGHRFSEAYFRQVSNHIRSTSTAKGVRPPRGFTTLHRTDRNQKSNYVASFKTTIYCESGGDILPILPDIAVSFARSYRPNKAEIDAEGDIIVDTIIESLGEREYAADCEYTYENSKKRYDYAVYVK